MITAFSLTLATGFSQDSLIRLWEKELSKSPVSKDKQSFCLQEKDRIIGQNIDRPANPASISKLYTTLWALDELGSQFKFQTKFIVKGQDLYIKGDSDPYFVTENLLLAINKLNKDGFFKFERVFFDKNFFLNWTDSPVIIEKYLSKLLNKKKWDNKIKGSLIEANQFLYRNKQRKKIEIKSIESQEVVSKEQININDERYTFTLTSSPIWQHLKQVNMYSNNFYSDKIFNYLGGEKSFNKYIQQKLNVTNQEIHFYTGSGLGTNYTTCRTTLKLLKELSEKARSLSLKLQDFIAVPGTDSGTMKERFISVDYNQKVLAKTGTLNNTSAFAGFILKKDLAFFSIFNHTKPYSNKARIRKLQDSIVKKIIDLDNFKNTIEYSTPDYISIKDNLIY